MLTNRAPEVCRVPFGSMTSLRSGPKPFNHAKAIMISKIAPKCGAIPVPVLSSSECANVA